MRKTLAWLFAPLLLWTGMAFASDPVLVVIDNKLVKAESVVQPKVAIQGADVPVPLGEIVILQAKVTNEVPNYVKKREYNWSVTESGYIKRYWSDNDKVIFGAGVKPTKVLVELKVKLYYEIGTEQIILISEQKSDVVVGNVPAPPAPPDPPAPPAPPYPNPDPNPTPNPTPNLTGLSKLVYDWAVVFGPKEKTSAAILAKGFRDIGVQAGHDLNLRDIPSILKKTKEVNNANLLSAGVNPKIWDAWGTKLQDHLYDNYTNGTLKTIDEFKKAWADIDKGLSYFGSSSRRR